MDSGTSHFLSSTSLDMNVETIPLPTAEYSGNLNVTTVLNYCKTKILNPYLRLLSLIGLRQLTNHQEPNGWLQFLNCIYTTHVIILLLIGYILQYLACFRRDRGFCYIEPPQSGVKSFYTNSLGIIYDRICQGPAVFSFIIPGILHLTGYSHAIFIIRHSDEDQLPVLMERVFISSTYLSNGFSSQRRLVRTLWSFVAFTGFWMILSMVVVNFMMADGEISFKWLGNRSVTVLTILKVLLVVCTLWHDVIQVTIVSNYCLQTQLLTTYLHFLREKLLQYPIEPLEWIRNIENFKNMLNYINNAISPSVCMFTFMNIACTISGIIWLFNFDDVDKETIPIIGISVLNVALWLLISLAPFIQAARLSNACEILRSAGQEVRTRPFVHQDTPGYELDSILLYTASLKLRAKLYCVPITGKYLCLISTLTGICVLVLGQCHYLNSN